MSSRFDLISAPSNIYTRRADESAIDYDSRVIDSLNVRYRAQVDVVIARLQSIEFTFDSLRDSHTKQLRRELIARHSMPYLLTYETYFPDRRPNLDALSALIAAHTLALTQLDYHLDGSDPDPLSAQTAVKVGQETAASYAVKMLMVAGAWAEKSGIDLFSNTILPVSGFVIERMHEDWIERFSMPPIQQGEEFARKYIESSNSRLLSSGYWEVMCRGAFSAERQDFPEDLHSFVRGLRLARQLADEADDVSEDLEAGMITLPTLFALSTDNGEVLRQRVCELWAQKRSGQVVDTRVVTRLIQTPHVARRLQETAGIVRSALPTDGWSGYGGEDPSSPPLSVLFDLKLAFLERTLARYVGPRSRVASM